ATMFGKGLKALSKAYGSQGFINMVPTPVPTRDDAKKTVSWNIDIDEGKRFYVSRIEFSGNTVTRDKVIRRELVLEEGNVYSRELWDMSVLRLNPLDNSDWLRVKEDPKPRKIADNGSVDL